MPDEPSYPVVTCRWHGEQASVLLTRADRSAKERDVPDYYLCEACLEAGIPPGKDNSVLLPGTSGRQGRSGRSGKPR